MHLQACQMCRRCSCRQSKIVSSSAQFGLVIAGVIPFTWTDPACSTETYILAAPSEHPSNRRDALAVQAFLDELIQNPPQAFEMYALLGQQSAPYVSGVICFQCLVIPS